MPSLHVSHRSGAHALGRTHLVQQKRHEPSRNDRVADKDVPCGPLLFEPVELAEVDAAVQVVRDGGLIARPEGLRDERGKVHDGGRRVGRGWRGCGCGLDVVVPLGFRIGSLYPLYNLKRRWSDDVFG